MKIRLFTIPNFFTLGNLMCGCCAVLFMSALSPIYVFWLVIASAVFDFLDGFSARILHKPSEIGIELDSLADMVSFGLVPAAALMRMFSYPDINPAFGWPEWAYKAMCFIPLLITAFSALRLAKFNVDQTQHNEFCGLPTPANALFCTSFAAIAATKEMALPCEAVAAISIVCAILLITPVRMFSLKFHNLGWKGNEVRYIFIALAICTIILLAEYSVPAIIVLYIAVSLIRNAVNAGKARITE